MPWRLIGLTLGLVSVGILSIVVGPLVWWLIHGRNQQIAAGVEQSGMAFFFALLAAPVLIGLWLSGVIGLLRWWRVLKETVFLGYGLIGLLIALPMIEPMIDAMRDVRHGLVPPTALVMVAAWGSFILATTCALLSAFRSRRLHP